MDLVDWNEGKPCEEDGISFCAKCKPRKKRLPDHVYATPKGKLYHRNENCNSIYYGQIGASGKGHRKSKVQKLSLVEARKRHLQPCPQQFCFPKDTILKI